MIVLIGVCTCWFLVIFQKNVMRDNAGLLSLLLRPIMWVYNAIFLLHVMLFTWICVRWKQSAKSIYKRIIKSENNGDNAPVLSFASCYHEITDINGNYYLWYMYFDEFIENTFQYYNLVTVYNCNLNVDIIKLIMIVMLIESGRRLLYTGNLVWRSSSDRIHLKDRDMHILFDFLLELFFLVFPYAMIQTNVNLPLMHTLQILLPPTLSLLYKFNTIIKEVFFSNVDKLILLNQKRHSLKVNRRRQSLFRETQHVIVAQKQNRYFPRWAKILVFWQILIYFAVVIITLITQISSATENESLCKELLNDDTHLIWNIGCKIKIPFCNQPFKARCNCMLLELNGHNLTTLPHKFVEMDGLQRISLQHGPLSRLPTNFEKLEKLAELDLSFNVLDEFNIDISKWVYLHSLIIQFNNIVTAHKSIWVHPTLSILVAGSNVGLKIPLNHDNIYLPSLFFFDISNNSVLLPNILGKDQMPSVSILRLSENIMPKNSLINIESLSPSLTMLMISRCKLVTIPTYLANFEHLQYIDGRDNNISVVSDTVTTWIRDKKVEAYFDGNKILCETNSDYSTYCESLCSKYCWSKYHKDGSCDPDCNSKKCEFDGGDCS
jgi:hypothetical protein